MTTAMAAPRRSEAPALGYRPAKAFRGGSFKRTVMPAVFDIASATNLSSKIGRIMLKQRQHPARSGSNRFWKTSESYHMRISGLPFQVEITAKSRVYSFIKTPFTPSDASKFRCKLSSGFASFLYMSTYFCTGLNSSIRISSNKMALSPKLPRSRSSQSTDSCKPSTRNMPILSKHARALSRSNTSLDDHQLCSATLDSKPATTATSKSNAAGFRWFGSMRWSRPSA
mmetsp:Transcript_109970/g.317948  ORF Transcript_109970/g.317948 Transcript_109970/m.317948 type:complete len:227 (+) Transcript_109970:211-891(+)